MVLNSLAKNVKWSPAWYLQATHSAFGQLEALLHSFPSNFFPIPYSSCSNHLLNAQYISGTKSIFNRIDIYDYVMIQTCDYGLRYLKIYKKMRSEAWL